MCLIKAKAAVSVTLCCLYTVTFTQSKERLMKCVGRLTRLPLPFYTHSDQVCPLWVFGKKRSFFRFKVDILAPTLLKVSVQQKTTSVGRLTALTSRKDINDRVQS